MINILQLLKIYYAIQSKNIVIFFKYNHINRTINKRTIKIDSLIKSEMFDRSFRPSVLKRDSECVVMCTVATLGHHGPFEFLKQHQTCSMRVINTRLPRLILLWHCASNFTSRRSDGGTNLFRYYIDSETRVTYTNG